MPKNERQPWTEALRREAQGYYAQGWSYPRIGRQMGRSASGVLNALRGRVPKRATADRFWSSEEDARLRAQIAQAGGIDLVALGEMLGRSSSSVRHRMKRKHRDLLGVPAAQQELPLAAPAPSAKQNGIPSQGLSHAEWIAIGVGRGWLTIALKDAGLEAP